MSRMFTPVNQKLLTNVSVVRLRKGGMRFEIACYPNKVNSWRAKVEKDIDEVLQLHTVYTNVSKGLIARSEDLLKVFGTDDHDAVCLEILAHGEVQVSEKERQAQLETLFRDIATIVSEKCVNPETGRPYPVGLIERAMRDAHFATKPTYSAKQQALEVIRLLETIIPIKRAQMRLRVSIPGRDVSELREALRTHVASVEKEEHGDTYTLVCLADPGAFRQVDELVRSSTHGKGSVEVLSLAVLETTAADIDELGDRSAAIAASAVPAPPGATAADAASPATPTLPAAAAPKGTAPAPVMQPAAGSGARAARPGGTGAAPQAMEDGGGGSGAAPSKRQSRKARQAAEAEFAVSAYRDMVVDELSGPARARRTRVLDALMAESEQQQQQAGSKHGSRSGSLTSTPTAAAPAAAPAKTKSTEPAVATLAPSAAPATAPVTAGGQAADSYEAVARASKSKRKSKRKGVALPVSDAAADSSDGDGGGAAVVAQRLAGVALVEEEA